MSWKGGGENLETKHASHSKKVDYLQDMSLATMVTNEIVFENKKVCQSHLVLTSLSHQHLFTH